MGKFREAEYTRRAFGTMKSEIAHLAAWLQEHGVSEVVMESTAQYWRLRRLLNEFARAVLDAKQLLEQSVTPPA
jgi:hypothetical protein